MPGCVSSQTYDKTAYDLETAKSRIATLESTAVENQLKITARQAELAAAQPKVAELESAVAIAETKAQKLEKARRYAAFLKWWLSGGSGTEEAQQFAALGDPEFEALCKQANFTQMFADYKAGKAASMTEWKDLMAKYVTLELYLLNKMVLYN